MPLPEQIEYTIEDIYNLPDGQRAELIDGDIYMMSPPSRKHQKISGDLYFAIRSYIASKGGSCEVYPAPFAVFLNADDKNYVDPAKDRIMVWNFETEDQEEYTLSDTVKAGIYDDLAIDFSSMDI